MKVLIDADIIAFRSGFAAEKSKYLVTSNGVGESQLEIQGMTEDAASAKKGARPVLDVIWTRKEVQPEEQALLICDVMISDIKARYEAENPTLHLFLSGVGNHRHAIATRASYKGNRTGSVPPTHLKALRNHLQQKWGATLSQGEEADDIIARTWQEDQTSVIATTDKDFNQLAARLYNFVDKEEIKISVKDACKNFYAQVISGDPVDSIPGVTGYGPVKSKKALADCSSPKSCWDVTIELYENEFKTKGAEYALESARLVKIGMPKGVLWSPPHATETTKKDIKAQIGSRGGLQVSV